MKRICLVLSMLMLSGCSKGIESVSIPNPIKEVSSIQEANQITGFGFNIPDTINNNGVTSISVIDDNLTDVRYGDTITIRKSSLPEDISGDYNEYDSYEIKTIENVDVTIKSTNSTYEVTWYEDDYSYSFYAENMDREILIEEVTNIITLNK